MEASCTFFKLALSSGRGKQSQIYSMGGVVDYLFLYLVGIKFICSEQCLGIYLILTLSL